MNTLNLLKRKAFFTSGCLLLAIAASLSPALAQSNRPTPQPPQPINATPSKDAIYNYVQLLPSFPGGMDKLGAFLGKNIKYPVADRSKNISGKVVTQFVVERDGSLSNIKILRTPTDAMAKEAERVLKLSPRWIPAKQEGKVVRAHYTIPISFIIPA